METWIRRETISGGGLKVSRLRVKSSNTLFSCALNVSERPRHVVHLCTSGELPTYVESQ